MTNPIVARALERIDAWHTTILGARAEVAEKVRAAFLDGSFNPEVVARAEELIERLGRPQLFVKDGREDLKPVLIKLKVDPVDTPDHMKRIAELDEALARNFTLLGGEAVGLHLALARFCPGQPRCFPLSGDEMVKMALRNMVRTQPSPAPGV